MPKEEERMPDAHERCRVDEEHGDGNDDRDDGGQLLPAQLQHQQRRAQGQRTWLVQVQQTSRHAQEQRRSLFDPMKA